MQNPRSLRAMVITSAVIRNRKASLAPGYSKLPKWSLRVICNAVANHIDRRPL